MAIRREQNSIGRARRFNNTLQGDYHRMKDGDKATEQLINELPEQKTSPAKIGF
jgi:hypothetical protein